MKKTIITKKILLTFISIILFFNISFSSSKISLDRIEPPFWWIGMKIPDLQLLVHGKNIAETSVNIDYEGIKLRDVTLVENPDYLFLHLVISKKTKSGKFIIYFKKANKIISTYEYELKKRRKNSEYRQGFNSSDVIYLLMPDRFSNGDPSNDNVKGMKEKADRNNPDGRHGGDIKGIVNHLNYLQNLGITALWINPLLENNMNTYSYHGYAITDYYKIDPRFGTNRDYLNLIDDCHKKGIKVIMDMVFNHCGIGHWWMKDLPMKDWIHQFPKFTRTNYCSSVIVDPHASDFDRNLMLKGWFDKTMPDLNQNNKFLATYLIQNSIWWIENANIDGIRMDTYTYSNKNMMAKWTKRVLKEYPDFNIVGETWLPKPSLVSYWQKDALNKDGYNSYLPSVFDFPLYYALGKSFNEKETWNKGLIDLYNVLCDDYLYANPQNIVIFTDNHDCDRFFSKINKNLKSFKMAVAFLLTTRGIPEIYYGTEILMQGFKHNGDGDIRKDFPGGWKNDKINAFYKEGRNKEQNEAFDYLQNLLKWRKNKDVIHTGKLKHFIPHDGVYVYFRYNKKETIMVLLNNNNNEDKTINTKRFAECMRDYKYAKNIINGKTIYNLKSIIVPAKSAVILELKK